MVLHLSAYLHISPRLIREQTQPGSWQVLKEACSESAHKEVCPASEEPLLGPRFPPCPLLRCRAAASLCLSRCEGCPAGPECWDPS